MSPIRHNVALRVFLSLKRPASLSILRFFLSILRFCLFCSFCSLVRPSFTMCPSGGAGARLSAPPRRISGRCCGDDTVKMRSRGCAISACRFLFGSRYLFFFFPTALPSALFVRISFYRLSSRVFVCSALPQRSCMACVVVRHAL